MNDVFYIWHNRMLAVRYAIKSRRHGDWIDVNWLPLTATSPAAAFVSPIQVPFDDNPSSTSTHSPPTRSS